VKLCGIHENVRLPCATCERFLASLAATARDEGVEYRKHSSKSTRDKTARAVSKQRRSKPLRVFGAPKAMSNAEIARRSGLHPTWVGKLRKRGVSLTKILDGSYVYELPERVTPWRTEKHVVPQVAE
jgi:hypothetical protein